MPPEPDVANVHDAPQNPTMALVEEVLASEPAPRRVVELGCGTGRRLAGFLERGTLRVIGVDGSEDHLTAARRRRVEARWIHADVGDRLDLLDGCADRVLVCLALGGHDPAPVFAEAARLLADDGELLVFDGPADADVLDAVATAHGFAPGTFATLAAPGDHAEVLQARWRRAPRTAATWHAPTDLPRHEAFAFFSRFGSPFFELTADVPLGDLRARCTAAGVPFHLVTLHAAVGALHAVPELMLRLEGGHVVQHARVRVGSTHLDRAERVGFVEFAWDPDLQRFAEGARAAYAAGRERSHLTTTEGSDIVYFSNVPWVAFRSITHADTLDDTASVPRLTFGGATARGGEDVLPVSLSVHHALADGLHVGWFFRFLEDALGRALQPPG